MAYVHMQCTACKQWGMLELHDAGDWSDKYEGHSAEAAAPIIHEDLRDLHPGVPQSTYKKMGAVCVCGGS